MRLLTVAGVMCGVVVFVDSLVFADSGTDSADLLNRPIIGYVAQSSTPELRAILGVPGAAVFSDLLPLPSNVRRLYISSGQGYALLDRTHEDLSVLFLKGDTADQMTALSGAIASPDVVSFSPSGRSAVIFAESIGFQVVTGLPRNPIVGRVADVSLFPDSLKTLSVSDDGRYIIASSSTGVYWIPVDGPMQMIMNVTSVAALTFLPGAPAAVIGDRDTGSVYVIHGSTEPTAKLLATNLGGLSDISPSVSGETLYLSSRNSNCVWSVQTSTGEVGLYELPIRPFRLERLLDTDRFLIASEVGEPAWIFFRQSNNAKTVFVPAAARPPEPEIVRSGGKHR